MKKILTVVLACTLLVFFAAGCANNGASETQNGADKTIQLGYVNWAEGIAMTNLAEAILEDKMGYKVESTAADVAPLFTSLASGNTDAFLDCWLPLTHEDYMKEYGDKIDDLGYNYEGAIIGLVVPDYVEIDSIEQLNANKEAFNGQIIGIDSGAGIMRATERAIPEYGLEYELVTGSGPAMTAALGKAIDNKESIVVTGWTPHWKFARWDLKFLEDPKNIYGSSENIHTVTRKGFSEDMPEVAEFFRNMKFTDDQLGSLMGAVEEATDPLEAAREWMNENEELVNSWIPGE
ncbi:MAG TPA: glycine betaine ABC transporter substrate-binding protein [Clostridia bacterium]|nr:glycine betaine ABC transporter substrate-binding protein [Clostridia bacterium]